MSKAKVVALVVLEGTNLSKHTGLDSDVIGVGMVAVPFRGQFSLSGTF